VAPLVPRRIPVDGLGGAPVSTLVITRGLPGSGKTTYAKRFVQERPEYRSRLNRDDLRETMHGGAHGYPRYLEEAVTLAHRGGVKTLLLAGRDVICDDMNLSNKQVKEWWKIAKEAGAGFEVVDLTNVPLETCIERDAERLAFGGHSVGAEYITKKHQQFVAGRKYPLPLPPEPTKAVAEPYVVPLGKPKCILVDIDGTMALNTSGREWFDWKRVGEDQPNWPVVNLVSLIRDAVRSGMDYYSDPSDFEIIFMSGRDEVCRPETTGWLEYLGFGSNLLFMRPSLPDGVQQPADHIVKLALFDEHIRHTYDVQFVLDDRDQVVEMWRSLGLTCLQVNYGAF
jgi:predicted kinase